MEKPWDNEGRRMKNIILFFVFYIHIQVFSAEQNGSYVNTFNQEILNNYLDSFLVNLSSNGTHIDTGMGESFYTMRTLAPYKYGDGWFSYNHSKLFFYPQDHTCYIEDHNLVNKIKPLLEVLRGVNKELFKAKEQYQQELKKYKQDKVKREQEQNKQDKVKREQEQNKQEQRRVYLKAKFPKNYENILNHKYWIGMTKEMLIASIGEPQDINRTITKYSTQEQWVYSTGYFYFDGSILTTIQD